MTGEAARRAPSPMPTLREIVERYRELAGEFGKRVELAAFGYAAGQTERIFTSCDEDYHISRFFHFSEAEGASYSIDGMPATHVAIDEGITMIL